jgi:RHS repeat-associated protein
VYSGNPSLPLCGLGRSPPQNLRALFYHRLAKDGKIQNDQSRRLTDSRAGQDAYVGDLDCNALGQTTHLQLGNGLVTTYDYYDTNFRLESVVTTGGLQDLSYTYDDVGNVQTMVDSVGGLNLSYGYDELDRLTGVSGSYGRTYSYNTIGNLEVKNGLTLYYEDADHPHAVSSTSEDWALDYSPAGNLITKTLTGSPEIVFSYDAENRLTQVVSDVVGSVLTTTLVYDGDGRRVKKVDESGTTVYVGEHYEVHHSEVYPSAIERVSVASDGTEGNDGSDRPSISADGRLVAFESDATNLVSSDTNGWKDIFVHDRWISETTRVSVASDGTEGDDVSWWPSISADGRFVAFESWASNLVVSDTNEMRDIFVHNRQTGETTRVSIASDGTEGNGGSVRPSISDDGRFVAFWSWASNLVVSDTNGRGDVFVASNPFLTGGSATKHYYANGQRIATRVDGALYYVHSDLLGSTVAVSDASGQAVGRVQYDPYGEVLTSTLPVTLTDRLFTGQRLDSSSGLYYYNARYYDPHLGRFIQPDTLVPDPPNPQAWNRFSYVYNNPVSYVDPSGHFVIVPAVALILVVAGGAVIIDWSAQMNYNMYSRGMSFWDAAYHENINEFEMVEAAVMAAGATATVVTVGPALVVAGGEAMTGIGLLTGSTTLYYAGVHISSAGEAVFAQLWTSYGTTPYGYSRMTRARHRALSRLARETGERFTICGGYGESREGIMGRAAAWEAGPGAKIPEMGMPRWRNTGVPQGRDVDLWYSASPEVEQGIRRIFGFSGKFDYYSKRDAWKFTLPYGSKTYFPDGSMYQNWAPWSRFDNPAFR